MTTDANRPCPDPLKDQDVSNALDNCDHKLITYVLNKLLADRLAQAQREASQAALEMAANEDVKHPDYSMSNGRWKCDCGFILDEPPVTARDIPRRFLAHRKEVIANLKPSTALELAKLRERLEEGEWWAEGKHDGVSDTCDKCERIADLRNRKMELERQ